MDAISYLILDLKPGTMKKYKNVALSVCLISCSLYAVLVCAETQYVSDQLEVTVRRGPTLSHAVLRMLKSGAAVEVLEVDAASGHTRVKTSAGTEGWILSRYLSAEPTARMQLQNMMKDMNHTTNSDQPVPTQLKNIRNEYDNASKRIAQLEGQNKKLEEQLASVKQTLPMFYQSTRKTKKSAKSLLPLKSD